ncbi:hypothetical protein EDB81DRAFT_69373 [Dactylonectria macrodidyma]|uniref:Zn(2)-C6 fungal-type domain-containing protein n=1 Tax=Dactylonectria macrodidyma TaxID=307937 RepID=A0A9P9EK58_9HYPO|nr:hypothetical protein EDB81DRAFT_69373 [Dactylonectria macrodidyma]
MSSTRVKKTDIVRKRTGCQRCRSKRRKCDESRPECAACVQRGLSCPGYQRQLTFKDVSALTAETSRRIEETKWSELRRNDARRIDRCHRTGTNQSRQQGNIVETTDSDSPGPECISFAQPDSPASEDLISGEYEFCASLPLPHQTLELSLDFLMEQISEAPHPILESASEIQDSTAVRRPGATTTIDRVPPLVETNSCIQQHSVSFENDDDPQVQLWEHFINFSEASPTQTPSNLLPPTGYTGADSSPDPSPPTEDALLRNFQENIVHMIPLVLPFEDLFRVSSGLRAAALALSSSHLCWTARSEPPCAKTRLKCQSDCHYYEFAVRDLALQMRQPCKRSSEQLFGAAMLLVYRDLLVGSAIAVFKHMQKLETIATQLDVSSLCTPTLLRAWRMLLCDMRTRMMPTRKSAMTINVPQQCLPWDAQLTIRDLYSSIWSLHARFVLESSFNTVNSGNKVSASQAAVQWLYSVLGRQCDLHQLQQKDYHEDILSATMVAERCSKFETCLDNWHRTLQPHDLPRPILGKTQDIITGSSFGAIVPYQFTDERKALDYISYLLSRIMCSYLQSRVQEPSSASTSQAYAWIILGIAATIGLRKHQFAGPGIFAQLLVTSMLSDGTMIATAILDGLLPRATALAQSPLGAFELRSLRKMLELIIREKNRGKAIRIIISAFDEHESLDKLFELQSVVAFGDCNGREPFRDVYQFPES